MASPESSDTQPAVRDSRRRREIAKIIDDMNMQLLSCAEAKGGSGVYEVLGRPAYCDMGTSGGGWLLVYSNTVPPHDYGGAYHANLATLSPTTKGPLTLWNVPAAHMPPKK